MSEERGNAERRWYFKNIQTKGENLGVAPGRSKELALSPFVRRAGSLIKPALSNAPTLDRLVAVMF